MSNTSHSYTRLLTTLVITCVVAAFTAHPAAAQTAKKLKCNGCVKSKQLQNNGIKGKDIKDGQVTGADLNSDISIGTSSNDGDLSVKNPAGVPTVSLDGATGNVTNLFSNTAGESNGLVKAWAQINADGSILSCWRCNQNPGATKREDVGSYVVDFTPLGTDIRGRPGSATSDIHGGSGATTVNVTLGLNGLDLSSVRVTTFDTLGPSITDAPFTLLIY